MMIQADAMKTAANLLSIGELKSTDEANVYIVKLMGVKLVFGSIPADVRKALNAAVKTGELGHIKKDGLLIEAYHHKNARAEALEARQKYARKAVLAITKVVA